MVRKLCGAVRSLRSLARVRTIVTCVTACPTHRRVVHRIGGERRRSIGVTAAALSHTRRYVRRRRETDRNYIVVAIDAVGIGCLMRKGRAKKRHCAGVTGFARQVCGNMVAGLAESCNAVVACGTTIGDAGVVKFYPDGKAYRARMAHLARRNGRDVGRCLSDGDCAVVAGCTGRNGRDLGMVDEANITPHGGLMTKHAPIRRQRVVYRLPGCRLTVMAIKAKSLR
jgi:hypothetical protein